MYILLDSIIDIDELPEELEERLRELGIDAEELELDIDAHWEENGFSHEFGFESCMEFELDDVRALGYKDKLLNDILFEIVCENLDEIEDDYCEYCRDI